MERERYGQYEQPAAGALSLRAGMRGEIHPITVTTVSKTFKVPTEWKGYIVRFHADGADLYYQISTDPAAVASVAVAARSGEANNPIELTAPATGCAPIQNGSYVDLQFLKTADTFALVGSVNCCARAHLAET